MNDRKFKMGLIGGGGKGFIGRVHVTAATLDREAELVAGAFRRIQTKLCRTLRILEFRVSGHMQRMKSCSNRNNYYQIPRKLILFR